MLWWVVELVEKHTNIVQSLGFEKVVSSTTFQNEKYNDDNVGIFLLFCVYEKVVGHPLTEKLDIV